MKSFENILSIIIMTIIGLLITTPSYLAVSELQIKTEDYFVLEIIVLIYIYITYLYKDVVDTIDFGSKKYNKIDTMKHDLKISGDRFMSVASLFVIFSLFTLTTGFSFIKNNEILDSGLYNFFEGWIFSALVLVASIVVFVLFRLFAIREVKKMYKI